MERERIQIHPDAVVEDADGQLGSVEEVILDPRTGEIMHLVVRPAGSKGTQTVLANEIAEVEGPERVKLRIPFVEDGERAVATPPQDPRATDVGRAEPHDVAAGSAGGRGDARAKPGATGARYDLRAAERLGGEIRVPVAEERLRVGKREVEAGAILIHKWVEELPEAARVALAREEVEVERVPVNRLLEAPAEVREEGDTLVVPLMREVLVVQKRLVLTEELRIRKRRVVEEREVRETVRRERVEVEERSGQAGGLETHRTPVESESRIARD